MRSNRFPVSLTAALAILFAMSFATTVAAAPTETILYKFSGTDGNSPHSTLIFDAAGNLYGTTEVGGLYDGGTVFELTPGTGGVWTQKVLYSFHKYGNGGRYPEGSLVFDTAGNLYGTTQQGGPNNAGTVFELTPGTGGIWTETTLHRFNIKDGYSPWAALIFDKSGNLFGTTEYGGNHNNGVIFELSPKSGGGWSEKLLHTFNHPHSHSPDGAQPMAELMFDALGNLYTTTFGGGPGPVGTVVELTPHPGANWTEAVIDSFGGLHTARNPAAGLVSDATGNLYGTTKGGGGHCNCGTVFELTPQSGGGWAETRLFAFGNTSGAEPTASLIFDANGNLYGTATGSGAYQQGTVFELMPAAGGTWTETVLHDFKNDGTDGNQPRGGLVFDSSGNLYGTTGYGGNTACQLGCGTIFKITP